MYELVKQKSRGQVILFGIIVFTFISAILRIAFHRSPITLNDEMIRIANEINSHAPVIIDSTTRFDYVNALNGQIFQYNYTLTSLQSDQVDTVMLKKAAKEAMIAQMHGNPKTTMLKENNIEIRLRYADKDGREVCIIPIPPAEYSNE